jgi:DNA-binding CsgD family transcriptional regulator
VSDRPVLSVAVRVGDMLLGEQLAELLATVPGLRIAGFGEVPDLVLSPGQTISVANDLTAREREVIALLAEGISNKEIAARLGITIDTAKFHVGRVIDKLDATGRTDAVAHAARRGVIHL